MPSFSCGKQNTVPTGNIVPVYLLHNFSRIFNGTVRTAAAFFCLMTVCKGCLQRFKGFHPIPRVNM